MNTREFMSHLKNAYRYFRIRLQQLQQRQGGGYALGIIAVSLVRWLANWFGYWYTKHLPCPQTFSLEGKTYCYFRHPYNATWSNERQVEIPVVRDLLARKPHKKILEVGNVLSHYFPISHTVLDKYEPAPHVLNEDVSTYTSTERYDLIVSISTLEHVGWDETPRDPTKVLQAIKNLKTLLAPGGEIIVTFPVGYHPVLDEAIASGAIEFSTCYCFKRISLQQWVHTSASEVIGSSYHRGLFPSATGLFIGVMR